ncbi:MAG: hypothetical protein ACR2KP_14970 [Egibacteraceae bacterium]
MTVADPHAVLPEPPDHVTSEAEQDRRLVRAMLALTPAQRLATMANWARVAVRASRGGPPGPG